MQQVSWEHRNGQLSEQIIEALLQWCARLAGIQHWKLFRNKIVKEDRYLCHFDNIS